MRAERADELLRTGEITLLGQLARSSNETFLVEVRALASQSVTGTDGDARAGEVPDPEVAEACSAPAIGDDAAPADSPVAAPDPDNAAPAARSFGPPDSDTACWAIYKLSLIHI